MVSSELERLKVEIMFKEEEYKKLNKKMLLFYIELPIGLMWFIYGIWVVNCMYKGGGENFLTVFGILALISLIYFLFITLGTKLGKQVSKLRQEIKQLKRQLEQELARLKKEQAEKKAD